jgi:phage-related holin
MKDYITGLLLSTLAIFAPIKALLLVTGILIFSDLISGILSARKKGQKISSAGMRRTVTKVAVYNAAIMLGFLTETYMLDGFLPLSKIAAGLISVVEFKSILENLDTINVLNIGFPLIVSRLSILENLDTINGNPIFKTLIEKLGSINDNKKTEE